VGEAGRAGERRYPTGDQGYGERLRPSQRRAPQLPWPVPAGLAREPYGSSRM
jgi:hypothetical protein